ncbi:alpha/beta hydrolase [Hymenobacter sp. 15J16-1T3B]|uniref:alpha/beta hydrolase n=1 Tax=Hymenobacter sp. 15J16-1T3B TaxID=2886941 RepID=UPI001D10CBAE|nr:alpha/beta fold hydrolase [Hymenobacter sp. 15J16-1T3B]MCC3159795.1 alpha/beta hydrolase [Hymenobacter sp. 15J16-1T3B]
MKFLLILLGLGLSLYVLLCLLLYFQQERLLFFPDRLPADYRFRFPGRWEERWTTAPDGTRLHGLLFHTPQRRRGVVFYLHGNGGALDSWGEVAALYTDLGYDVFLLDYRGYGKSEGRLSSEPQLLTDVEAAYQQLLTTYAADSTVVLGYSLGTGPAAWLAARHRPRLLILQAPYYSMQDMARSHYPWVPGFLVRYPLRTYEVLPRVQAPVVLFHGDQDEVIYPGSSRRLRALLKPTDRLIELPGAGHNGMTDNARYQQVLGELLAGQ